MKNIILAILFLIVLICGCLYVNNNFLNKSNENNQENKLATEEIVKNKSNEVLISINEGDIEKFKTLIHPTKGVRFSKDGVISIETDKKFTASEIDKMIKTNETILWGYMDGSGLPINKTFQEYFSEFSKPDYLKAPKIAYNQQIRAGANTVSDIKKEYPEAHFMSYHYPYTSTYVNDRGEEVIQPLSWTTLNLVFEEYQGEYYLVGMVRDNWTI